MFSTSPASTPTHWKQTCFVFKQGIEVCKGAAIVGKIVVGKRNCNERELDVEIECWVEGNEADVISGTWVVA
jgi:protein arginine N-methyltransferase 3